eukprot:gene27511-48615_t
MSPASTGVLAPAEGGVGDDVGRHDEVGTAAPACAPPAAPAPPHTGCPLLPAPDGCRPPPPGSVGECRCT